MTRPCIVSCVVVRMLIASILWLYTLQPSHAAPAYNTSFPGASLPGLVRPKMRFETRLFKCGEHEDKINRSLAGIRYGVIYTTKLFNSITFVLLWADMMV